jgi:hypothetical protein
MVPMEIESHDPRGLLFDIGEDGKIVIFNPLHPHMDNLSRDPMALEQIGQSKETHGQKIDPDELINGSIVISQLRNMEKKAAQSFHRGNCKMARRSISTPPPKLAKGKAHRA